ncbi:hypothetical protein HELRODRAFT_183166 [Helobdella robusta]|uniref:Uncharacterized protein n=1 Tax=Helobdella robusta TaxID=6412 RepID=T1FJ90_HELRO|nr:hypothetical protein HELRODRAFT_183166 [Helobdella robusta]ESO11471.1 hypothetical protein HELRODRAFT_183166 [Helobdella robusta]
MNEEKLQKSEPMEIPSCVRNYTNEYRIQQRTLGPQIAQQKQNNEADLFSQNPRPVFTGPVSRSVGFRTTLASFHWAVESGWLSHNPGLFSLGRRVWLAFAEPTQSNKNSGIGTDYSRLPNQPASLFENKDVSETMPMSIESRIKSLRYQNRHRLLEAA